ncbi:MAG: dihydroorotase, partial [Pseudomonadota bacterium]|nr:dihydroorotase [Pseudomonadota bacterium]
MAEPVYDLTITNGTLATHETSEAVNIAITDGRFAALRDVSADQGREHIDATGLTILPGVIDTQVHFREPGIEHKEDLQSGSLA